MTDYTTTNTECLFLFDFNSHTCVRVRKKFLSSSMSYESERMKINEEKIFLSLNSSSIYFQYGGRQKMKMGYGGEEIKF